MTRREAAPAAGGASRQALIPWLFLAPGMVIFLVAIIYPMISAAQMSLYDWNVLSAASSKFIGFDNYVRAFHDPVFWTALANSGAYMVLTVPPQIILGLGIALLLKAKSPAQPVYRVLFYLPVVTSWVVVSLLFKYLFADEGLINWLLDPSMASPISWLSSRWAAMIAIAALGIWKGIGWSMMIFLAALQGIPAALEEAATMDGANRWQRFRVVSLPAIWPAMAFVLVMLVIGGFNVFISVLLMTGGGPAQATEVVLTYMYAVAFGDLDFGYGSAIAVLLTLVVFVLAMVQMRVYRTEDEVAE
jgi:multiple sugar transport system permease protein